MKLGQNVYPTTSRRLKALSALFAISVLGACTTSGSEQPAVTAVTEQAGIASPNNTPEARAINTETQSVVKCLASKILDLSKEKGQSKQVRVEEGVDDGTQTSVRVSMPTTMVDSGNKVQAILETTMKVNLDGTPNPIKATSVTLAIYEHREDGSMDVGHHKSFFRVVENDTQSGWNTFIRGENQTQGGVYTTTPIDDSNPYVQNLTISTLHKASGWANSVVDSAARGLSLTCI